MTPSRPMSLARRWITPAALAISFALAISGRGVAQAPNPSDHAKPESQPEPKKAPVAPPSPRPSPEGERQAQLVADTARLYKLAQELKAEVDRSSKDQMSLTVIKKAAEVEALARDLKERLKAESPKAK